jgi:3-oxoadipate enol-lactonase
MRADQGRYVQANGIETYCVIQGDGPWLVLSHSLACDHTMWDDQVELLSRDFRILRYDTRGHGRSTVTPGQYSLELLSDDLKGLLDALDIRQTHFVGLSMGGMIGQIFALNHQDMLLTLVLCDTTSSYSAAIRPIWMDRIRAARSSGMPSLSAPTLERWFTKEFRELRPDVMLRFGERIASTSLTGYAACSEALLDINVTGDLKEIRVPSLVVVGECDVGTPIAMAQAIHDNLPGSQMAVIARAAHFPNVEQPGAFTNTLLTFLQGVPPRAPLSTQD